MFIVSVRSFVMDAVSLLACVLLGVFAFMSLRDGVSGYDIILITITVLVTGLLVMVASGHLVSLVQHHRSMRGRSLELQEFLRTKHRLVNLLHRVPATPTVGGDMYTIGLSKDLGERLLIVRKSYGLECVIVDRIGTKYVNDQEVEVTLLKGITIPYSDRLPVLVHAFGSERICGEVTGGDEVQYAQHIGDQLREIIDRHFGAGRPTPILANNFNTANVDDLQELLDFMPESMRD